jgi:O-antigen/teichoic acid export membrane protein
MYIFSKLKTNHFAKSIMLITGGTSIAQALNIISTPILTRVYRPEEFGLLAIYISILSMISLVASLRYEYAIPIASDDKKAINALACSCILLFFIAIFSAIIIVTFNDFLSNYVSYSIGLIEFKYLIPLGLFFVGLYNIFVQWAFRKKDYRVISKTKIIQAASQNILSILLGLFGFTSAGLMIGRIVGQSAGIHTITNSFRTVDKKLLKEINSRDIAYILNRYRDFALFSAPGQLLNAAGIQLPVLFISALYGIAATGYYGLSYAIVNLPMTLIGMSIADVFYGEIANNAKRSPETIKAISNDIIKKGALIGLVPLLALLLFGPYLFALVFGVQWYEAGLYARIISPLVFARLVLTPVSRIFIVFEKQRIAFLLDALRLFLVLIIFMFASIFTFTIYEALQLYTFAMVLAYIITFLVANKVINDKINE